jgi:hypothetical protein
MASSADATVVRGDGDGDSDWQRMVGRMHVQRAMLRQALVRRGLLRAEEGDINGAAIRLGEHVCNATTRAPPFTPRQIRLDFAPVSLALSSSWSCWSERSGKPGGAAGSRVHSARQLRSSSRRRP